MALLFDSLRLVNCTVDSQLCGLSAAAHARFFPFSSSSVLSLAFIPNEQSRFNVRMMLAIKSRSASR
jgi:hypothetical protein